MEEDKVAIKFLHKSKHYGPKCFLKEFPAKQWPLSGSNRILKKIVGSRSIE